MMLKWPDVLNLAKGGNPAPDRKTVKTDAEWREQLSDEEYHVTRQAGTERAFSSEMCSLFEPGIYSCLCCETVLFDSAEKFESGTGWPSFTQPIKENVIASRLMGLRFCSGSKPFATLVTPTWATSSLTDQPRAACVIA
jgi:hypothetical protein